MNGRNVLAKLLLIRQHAELMRGARHSACGDAAWTWNRARIALLPALFGALAACQSIAGLDEDRALRPEDTKGTGDGGSTHGAGGAGSAGGEGGAATGGKGPRCSVEPVRKASRAGSGSPGLTFASGHYLVAWPYFTDGVAWNSLDEHGILQGDEDLVLLPPSGDLENSSVALLAFGQQILLGTSRRNAETSTNTPMLLTVDETGAVLSTGTAPSFESDWYPDVASLVTNADRSRILMVLRGVGQRGSTDLRRFNGNLTSLGEGTIQETWDAAATWAETLDRFGVFVLKQGTPQGMPKELWLHSFDTSGELAGITQTRINTSQELPVFGMFLHSVAAAATKERFLVAWTDGRHEGYEQVYLTSVDQGGNRPGKAAPSVWVSQLHPDTAQGAPSLLFDGKHIVVVWRSEDHLYLRRFTTELEPYGDEVDISGALEVGTEKPALVASEPGVYGVAYTNTLGGAYLAFQRVVCDDPS